MFFGRKVSPLLYQIFWISLSRKSSTFVPSFHSTYSQKQFFVQEHFGKIKLINNVTQYVKKRFVIFGFYTTHFYLTTLYYVSTYADTYHIQTVGNVFQNNSWVYINLQIQFLCTSVTIWVSSMLRQILLYQTV